MYKKLLLNSFVISAMIFFLASCREKPTVQDEAQDQMELPPSLQKPKSGPSLVKLSEKEQDELLVKTSQVKSSLFDYEITAPGVVFPAPDHSSIISSPINGQVVQIHVHEGGWVTKGQEMFHIQSLEYGTLVSDYLQARAEEGYQTSRMARLKQLVNESISSASELERATAEYERATTSVKSAYAKLRAVGVSDSEINSFSDTDTFDPTLKIYAPINGVVEKNFVELGQSVNALENLSRVLDTRQVLIRGYVSPNDAVLVSTGNSVTISKREQEMSMLKAKITSINPGLDEASRSVVVNILVSTVDGWPKPGENLRLSIISETQKEIIAIPTEALTYDGDQAVVFIKQSAGIYEKRPVEVDEIQGQKVIISSGLAPGEEVAVTKVFSLKALSRFDIISEE